MSNLYNEESIQSLSPLEFTRLRPGVYCGSTEYSTQLLIEIVSNAVDEFKAGHGDTIRINISEDNIITVEDELYSITVDLMKKHEYVEFLVGRDGAFDILVASVILRAKREYRNDNSSLIWVMPYPKSDYYKNAEEYEGYYDEIEIYSQQNKCY